MSNLVFLRFPIFAVKLECLIYYLHLLCEMANLNCKKTEKSCTDEEKSLLGLIPVVNP